MYCTWLSVGMKQDGTLSSIYSQAIASSSTTSCAPTLTASATASSAGQLPIINLAGLWIIYGVLCALAIIVLVVKLVIRRLSPTRALQDVHKIAVDDDPPIPSTTTTTMATINGPSASSETPTSLLPTQPSDIYKAAPTGSGSFAPSVPHVGGGYVVT